MTNEEAIKELKIHREEPDYVLSIKTVDMAISALKDRPKGEWKRKVRYLAICWECSNCGHNSNYYSPLHNFCPDCGADMRGKAE